MRRCAATRITDIQYQPLSVSTIQATNRALSGSGAVGLVVVAIYLTFVGYLESDDLFYYSGAMGWLTHFPYVGSNHWSIRHCIVLPMALGFKLFGQSEATLLLPSLCYACFLLILLGSIAGYLAGWKAGWLAVALSGTTPAIATGASFVATDIPEAFFVIASIWSWHLGRELRQDRFMVLSGLAAGCALITRETTVALLLFYVAQFVFGRGRGFRAYLLLAVGLVAVVAADWLYLYHMSGDPLYRIHMALKGAQGDGPQLETVGDTASGVDRFGTIALPTLLRPFGAIFLNQNYGILFWFAVPAATWLSMRGSGEAKQSARAFLGFAGTWFVVSSYVLAKWLWVIPRYYIVGVILVIPLAIWLSNLMSRRPLTATIVCLLLLGSGLTLDFGSTVGVMAGERGLVAFVQAHPGVIHTDPATARGASWLLAQSGLENRVSTDLPASGELYYFDSRPRRPIPALWPLREIPSNWTELYSKMYPTKWTSAIVQNLGISSLLPPGLRVKIDPPPLKIGVYRVPSI